MQKPQFQNIKLVIENSLFMLLVYYFQLTKKMELKLILKNQMDMFFNYSLMEIIHYNKNNWMEHNVPISFWMEHKIKKSMELPYIIWSMEMVVKIFFQMRMYQIVEFIIHSSEKLPENKVMKNSVQIQKVKKKL